jgi:hypothetical protein
MVLLSNILLFTLLYRQSSILYYSIVNCIFPEVQWRHIECSNTIYVTGLCLLVFHSLDCLLNKQSRECCILERNKLYSFLKYNIDHKTRFVYI